MVRCQVPEVTMPLQTILIILLLLLLIGALPAWPYSADWGYAPGSLLGLVLILVIIIAFFGRGRRV